MSILIGSIAVGAMHLVVVYCLASSDTGRNLVLKALDVMINFIMPLVTSFGMMIRGIFITLVNGLRQVIITLDTNLNLLFQIFGGYQAQEKIVITGNINQPEGGFKTWEVGLNMIRQNSGSIPILGQIWGFFKTAAMVMSDEDVVIATANTYGWEKRAQVGDFDVETAINQGGQFIGGVALTFLKLGVGIIVILAFAAIIYNIVCSYQEQDESMPRMFGRISITLVAVMYSYYIVGSIGDMISGTMKPGNNWEIDSNTPLLKGVDDGVVFYQDLITGTASEDQQQALQDDMGQETESDGESEATGESEVSTSRHKELLEEAIDTHTGYADAEKDKLKQRLAEEEDASIEKFMDGFVSLIAFTYEVVIYAVMALLLIKLIHSFASIFGRYIVWAFFYLFAPIFTAFLAWRKTSRIAYDYYKAFIVSGLVLKISVQCYDIVFYGFKVVNFQFSSIINIIMYAIIMLQIVAIPQQIDGYANTIGLSSTQMVGNVADSVINVFSQVKGGVSEALGKAGQGVQTLNNLTNMGMQPFRAAAMFGARNRNKQADVSPQNTPSPFGFSDLGKINQNGTMKGTVENDALQGMTLSGKSSERYLKRNEEKHPEEVLQSRKYNELADWAKDTGVSSGKIKQGASEGALLKENAQGEMLKLNIATQGFNDGKEEYQSMQSKLSLRPEGDVLPAGYMTNSSESITLSTGKVSTDQMNVGADNAIVDRSGNTMDQKFGIGADQWEMTGTNGKFSHEGIGYEMHQSDEGERLEAVGATFDLGAKGFDKIEADNAFMDPRGEVMKSVENPNLREFNNSLDNSSRFFDKDEFKPDKFVDALYNNESSAVQDVIPQNRAVLEHGYDSYGVTPMTIQPSSGRADGSILMRNAENNKVTILSTPSDFARSDHGDNFQSLKTSSGQTFFVTEKEFARKQSNQGDSFKMQEISNEQTRSVTERDFINKETK